MPFIKTEFPGLLIFEPKVFEDARGYFFESFNARDFEHCTGVSLPFVQDNHSRSSRGVLRGLHYQAAPHAEGKLIRCTAGAIFDVILDVRRGSPALGRWIGIEATFELLSMAPRSSLSRR